VPRSDREALETGAGTVGGIERRFKMIRQLSDDEKTALLLRRRLGRLGCTVDGIPYVVPINYVFDGENIYSHSLPGTKIDALRMNPNACLQVDEISDEFHWQSVMAVGEYEEITGDDERFLALAQLLAGLPSLTPVESFHDHAPAPGRAVVFRIRIREISGVGEW